MDLASFALGFTGGLTVMGLVWLYFDIKRVLRGPQEFVDSVKRGLSRDVTV